MYLLQEHNQAASPVGVWTPGQHHELRQPVTVADLEEHETIGPIHVKLGSADILMTNLKFFGVNRA